MEKKYTIGEIYGNATHPELLKLKVALASKQSFDKAASILNELCAGKRSINNDVMLMRNAKSYPATHSVPSYSVAQPEALSLRDTVQYVVERHLAHAEKGALKSGKLYEAVQYEMEKGLFDAILKFTGGNESRAARILGLSRGTLRPSKSRKIP